MMSFGGEKAARTFASCCLTTLPTNSFVVGAVHTLFHVPLYHDFTLHESSMESSVSALQPLYIGIHISLAERISVDSEFIRS